MTTLAAQERRVLELKEELQKADADLEKLKKEWAVYEAMNKRNEPKHRSQLQPLDTAFTSPIISYEDDLARGIRELEKCKASSPRNKGSQRKVFSGSRHTRSLSLLSPQEPTQTQRFDYTNKVGPYSTSGKSNPVRPNPISSTSPWPQSMAETTNNLYRSPDKDAILETGKQLVGDFRQGLWTFFEDLKQVTVGEEVSNSSDRSQSHGVGRLSRIAAAKNSRSNVEAGTVKPWDNNGVLWENPRHEHFNAIPQIGNSAAPRR